MRNRNSFFPTLRVHLGHVLDGGGDAEVVALGVLELAADALDLVLAGAGPQRGGERAERAQACREKPHPQSQERRSQQSTPPPQRHSVERLECNNLARTAAPSQRAPATGDRSGRGGGGEGEPTPSGPASVCRYVGRSPA